MSNVNYLPDDDLKAAVELAINMEIPLFLTGEPGTGKTELAYWIAQNAAYRSNFGIQKDVLRFNVKTTSTAKDLLYRYDAIRHFRDNHRKQAEPGKEDNVLNYIHFEAFGQAIMAAQSGKRHVVLVDEIDKAPRDFPNDLLFEFEKLGFRIDEATNDDLGDKAFAWEKMPSLNGLGVQGKPDMDEQGFIFYADKAERDKKRGERKVKKPLLIITSNSEKNLPDAFLRRCAFFHIPFPENKEKLLHILEKKGLYDPGKKWELIQTAVDFFLGIRKAGLRRNPATAELIAWVEYLWELGIDPGTKLTAGDIAKLEPSLSMLGKNKEDIQRIKE
ncbi:MAG: MoxR family ATPase, partial [Saprospiraceae bacterium]|nr:MoxR family ATPase [Saprospiraceae bacterium]